MVTAAHARLAHGTIEIVPGGDHVTTPGSPAFGQQLKDSLRAHQQKKGGG